LEYTKFQRYSSHPNWDAHIRRATTGINATVVAKTILLSKVTIATMWLRVTATTVQANNDPISYS
jgi:hypothetical protein